MRRSVQIAAKHSAVGPNYVSSGEDIIRKLIYDCAYTLEAYIDCFSHCDLSIPTQRQRLSHTGNQTLHPIMNIYHACAENSMTGETRGQTGGFPRFTLRLVPYSHSMVPGGLEVMSYTTRLMPRTSLTIRLEMARSTSYGSGAQSAVMPSSECTARTQQV